MNLLDEIRKTVDGAQTLKDWIGDGVPVRQEHANGRAMACLAGNNGLPCPHNKAPKWWERFFKDPVAGFIRRQLEVKNRMKLTTPHDESIHMCSICGCCLTLKVWTPIGHIKAHTPNHLLGQFPIYCWQRREMDLT